MIKKVFEYSRSEQPRKLFTYGIGQLFNLITPLLVIPYLVAVCGEEGYGKIGVGMAISFFLIVLIDYGSDIVAVREVAVNREDPDKLNAIISAVYLSKLYLLAITISVISVIYLAVPFFNREPELYFLGVPILIGQFLNPTWFLQGLEDFRMITILTITSKLIYLVGIFTVIAVPGDYIYANLLWGLGMIAAHLGVLLYLCWSDRLCFKKVSRKTVFGLLRDNFSMFSSQIFVSLQLYAPIVLISYFGNNTMAGTYKIVEQIIVIFKTYIFLFFNYVYPRVCYLLEKNREEGLQFWKTFNGANFIFVSLSMATIYVFAEPIVGYFNPTDISAVARLLRFAVLIPFLLSISIPLKQLILGWNSQKYYIRVTMAMVLLNLVLIIYLLPKFEIKGVLASFVAVELLTIILFLTAIKKKLFLRS